ncbi:MAG: hypothetical protein JW863_12555 [Chitinispirillaceae bacterium]|nr:hypothetical protein [Chitinispirillaceae bacterium]
MIDRRTQLLLLGITLLLLITAVFYAAKIPGDIAGIRNRDLHSEDSTTMVRLSLINKAVEDFPIRNKFEYTGGFENPFKSLTESPVSHHRGTSSPTVSRSKFILKGILTKNKPLAILEDGLGETYIRGVGEKALEQTVVGIADNRVIMRDRLGTYELVVEEN